MRKHTFNQILSSVTACLLLLHMGVWAGYLSVMIPRFKTGQTPISMTLNNVSWVVTLWDIGTLLFSFPAGYLMDRFGRVFILRLAFVSLLLAVILILTASTPYPVYLAGFLVGVGGFVGFSTTALYVAEIAKQKIRGTLGSIGSVMNSVGMAATMTFGPYLSFETLTWATLFCPLTGFVLTFFMAESPYYYFIQNNDACAARALSRVRNGTKTNERDVELKSIRQKVEDGLKDPGNILELLSEKSNRNALIIVLILWITRVGGGTVSIPIYAPLSLPRDSDWDPKISMMIYSWLNVVFGLLGMGLVDRLGRKPLLIISLLGLSLVTAASAVFYYFHQRTAVDVTRFAFVPHVGVLLFGVLFSTGIGPVSSIYRGELFSVRIKGSASAIVQVVTQCSFNTLTATPANTAGASAWLILNCAPNAGSTICVHDGKLEGYSYYRESAAPSYSLLMDAWILFTFFIAHIFAAIVDVFVAFREL